MALSISRALRGFERETWNIGYVEQSILDITDNGIRKPVKWLKSDKKYAMIADPHAVKDRDGNYFIFAEIMSSSVGRGEIFSAKFPLDKQMKNIEFEVAVDFPLHASYPSIIFWKNMYLLFFESWEANGLVTFSSYNLAGPWKFVDVFLFGSPIVDPTIFYLNDTWFLFCTHHDDNPQQKLYLYIAPTPFGPWKAHTRSPVKEDCHSARPAGPIFMGSSGQLYRPAQDCSSSYGGAITIMHISTLTLTTFSEVAARHLSPPSAEWRDGLHTICSLGSGVLIDGKRTDYALSRPAQSLLSRHNRYSRIRHFHASGSKI